MTAIKTTIMTNTCLTIIITFSQMVPGLNWLMKSACLCSVPSCGGTVLCHAMSCHVMSRHVMSCHVTRCDLSDVGGHAPHYCHQPQQPVVVQELQGVLRSTQLYTCHVLTRHGKAATCPTWKVSRLSEPLSSQPTVSTQGTPPPLSRCS